MTAKKIKSPQLTVVVNATEIVDRLIEVLELNNQTELADYLGVSLPTISSWKSRNSIDWTLIIEKLGASVNINWLLSGRGDHRLNQDDILTLKDQLIELQGKLIEALEENRKLVKRK